ncbi:MAG: hypothetical protein [Apis polycipivirus]|nr:MAG: hypothetical protein [Apis polycipivirus]
MNNEEPQLTQIANLQIASAGHKLPEQSQVATCSIPRPFGLFDLIHQWQPMGIRVTLNIPFVGDDHSFIFAIRNGPFIPGMTNYSDFPPFAEGTEAKTRVCQMYAWNNMRNVLHGKDIWEEDMAEKDSVFITQYDHPPTLSSLAQMFRKWRGTMCYRIRTVAGFTTQGYPFVTSLKNRPSRIGIYDSFKILPVIPRIDSSYREGMQNSYIMGDTAMVRHFEFSMPFEYPVPWYDQYAWISRRVRPSQNFYQDTTTKKYVQLSSLTNEPHGDNYACFGLRGALNTSVNEAQITFELEYRAGDDFQFSDPGLPLGFVFQNTHSIDKVAVYHRTITVPSKEYYTDGMAYPQKVPSTPPVQARVANSAQATPKPKAARKTRDLTSLRTDEHPDIGYDTVDSDNDVADLSSVASFNMRKSLRTRNLYDDPRL